MIIFKWNNINEVAVSDPIVRNHCIAKKSKLFQTTKIFFVCFAFVNDSVCCWKMAFPYRGENCHKSSTLHKKTKFFIKDFFKNVIKSAGNCGFGHIYWRNPEWKTSFFLCKASTKFNKNKHRKLWAKKHGLIWWLEKPVV